MKFFLYGDLLNPSQLKRRAPEHQFLMLATFPNIPSNFADGRHNGDVDSPASCRHQ